MIHSSINSRPYSETGTRTSRRCVGLACLEAAVAPYEPGALGDSQRSGVESHIHNSCPGNGLGLFHRSHRASTRVFAAMWHATCNSKPVTGTPKHGFECCMMRQEVTTTKQTISERSVRGARVRLADRLSPTVVGIRRGVGGSHGRRMPIMRTTRGVHRCRLQADTEAGGRSVVDRHAVDSADMDARAAGGTR